MMNLMLHSLQPSHGAVNFILAQLYTGVNRGTRRERLTFGKEGSWGPIQRLQLTCFPSKLIVRFAQGHLELLLKTTVFCFQFLDPAIFSQDHQVTACICFPN
jgi:hypothetical protein